MESHLNKTLAFQIRALRDRGKWTQAEFAKELGIKYQNNVSARLENPNYGKHTLTTLKKIAARCDVGLVVWFVPFGRLVDWATGTTYEDKGLSPDFYNIPAFTNDPGLTAPLAAPGPVPTDIKSETPTEQLGQTTRQQLGESKPLPISRIPPPQPTQLGSNSSATIQ